jgi:hypothetical protein
MMRLPARLTAQLAKARIARIFKSAAVYSLIHCVDPAEILHPGSVAPVSRERMQRLVETSSPVIWIGGSEPLAHPGIGHFVRAIGQNDRFVFLEINGALLRRRIHEFQPLPGLFLVVRLDELQGPESELALEGLRAARLSGFFTVIHSVVRENRGLAGLGAIRSFILRNDLDGWLMTAESADQAVVHKAAEARRFIPGLFWRQFSKQIEQAILAGTKRRAVTGIPPADESDAGTKEANVKVA